MYANRLKHRGNHPADRRQRRVVDIIDDLTVQREAVQRAEEDTDDNDHFTRPQDEAFQALPGLDKQALHVRNVIHRQLHHERRSFAAHNGMLQHQSGRNRHHDPQHVQGEDRQRAVLAEKGGGEDGENRQPRAAGHKRRHHNGHRHQRQHGIDPPANPLGEEYRQPVREMQGIANPLYTVNKDSHGTGIKNRLQRAANINRQ